MEISSTIRTGYMGIRVKNYANWKFYESNNTLNKIGGGSSEVYHHRSALNNEESPTDNRRSNREKG